MRSKLLLTSSFLVLLGPACELVSAVDRTTIGCPEGDTCDEGTATGGKGSMHSSGGKAGEDPAAGGHASEHPSSGGSQPGGGNSTTGGSAPGGGNSTTGGSAPGGAPNLGGEPNMGGEPGMGGDLGMGGDGPIPTCMATGDYSTAAEMPGGKCYVYFESRATWDESMSACVSMNGTLAVLSTPEMVAFVTDEQLANSNAWVGATDIASEGNWVWQPGGEAASWTWGDYEPNGGTDENCSEYQTEGRFNDLFCTSERPFICEFVGGPGPGYYEPYYNPYYYGPYYNPYYYGPYPY